MPAPNDVRRLVKRFHENRASYVSCPYTKIQKGIELNGPREFRRVCPRGGRLQRGNTALGVLAGTWSPAEVGGRASSLGHDVHQS